MPINKGYGKRVDEIKEKAEKCMKEGRLAEAFFHWTHAIKLIPEETDFYFQRSKCFLSTQQYYYALEDSKTLISKGKCVQGYSRMSEVYYQTQNYDMAIEAFQKSFQNSASRQEKETFLDWSRKCKRELAKQKSLEARYPFVGAAIGIVIAAVAVAADFASYGTESTIGHPLLKVLVVVVVSFSCYIVASLIRNQIISSRKSILEPPPDLFGDRKIHKD